MLTKKNGKGSVKYNHDYMLKSCAVLYYSLSLLKDDTG